MNELPLRKPNRLKEYDYSQNGAYFVTMCVKNRQWMLWERSVGAIINRPLECIPLNEIGQTVERAILNIEHHYDGIMVEKYVVMPNHVHLLLLFQQYDLKGNPAGGRLIIAPTELSNIIRQLKSYITKQLGQNIWQKGFHDHVVRNQQDYLRIWNYIDGNPYKWTDDCYYVTE